MIPFGQLQMAHQTVYIFMDGECFRNEEDFFFIFQQNFLLFLLLLFFAFCILVISFHMTELTGISVRW